MRGQTLIALSSRFAKVTLPVEWMPRIFLQSRDLDSLRAVYIPAGSKERLYNTFLAQPCGWMNSVYSAMFLFGHFQRAQQVST